MVLVFTYDNSAYLLKSNLKLNKSILNQTLNWLKP